MKYWLILCSFCFLLNPVIGQNTYSLQGILRDEATQKVIVGAAIFIKSQNRLSQTDNDGRFYFKDLSNGSYTLVINELGYQRKEHIVSIHCDTVIDIFLQSTDIVLDEVVINDSQQRINIVETQQIGKSFVLETNGSSFAQTLSKLSGLSSMNIGSAASKPFIRGMGFNRIAVVDKGVMQQDQQWGADHGLEIDQYNVDDVLIHKGPMSLQFGSDAMGGAIEILPTKTPTENIFFGDAIFTAKSNNDLLGLSVMNALKHNKLFVKARYTGQRFGDYRVPTDNFNYLTYDLPIYNRRLKNTAGKDDNLSAIIRFTENKFETSLNISNVYRKTGFFPGAHGIPDKSRLLRDGSYRNIEMPYSNVNHFKIISNTDVKLSPSILGTFNLGFQDNHRQEWAYFHTHYGNMLPPKNDPDLELDFKLNTYSVNAKLTINDESNLSHITGFSGEIQQNRVAGYSFLLPEFNQSVLGGYWLTSYKYNKYLTFQGGVRYDYGQIDITGFYDPTLAEYLQSQGIDANQIEKYAQRAYEINTHFGNMSGSFGFVLNKDNGQEWRANLGTSFRMPTANELASNGVHHGAFRHEQGNPELNSERGYQVDIAYSEKHKTYQFMLSPFFSYYSNYIFLEPQGEWSVLPHAGQIYRYSGAEAYFAGAEYSFGVDLTSRLGLLSSGEYVYNQNLTDNYALPFSPPFSMRNELSYKGPYKGMQSYKIALEHQFFAAQNRVSQNEKSTPQTNLFNCSLNTNFKIAQFMFSINLQVVNLFDVKYLNHMSFYRKLNIPEPGRNIQLLIKIPFYK